MKRYWVAIYRPTDYDPASEEDEALRQGIDRLNREMVAAGVRVFVGGLASPEKAKSLHHQKDGQILPGDGVYLKASHHVGGFWVLACADDVSAWAWGRKAAEACRASVEVRPFNE